MIYSSRCICTLCCLWFDWHLLYINIYTYICICTYIFPLTPFPSNKIDNQPSLPTSPCIEGWIIFQYSNLCSDWIHHSIFNFQMLPLKAVMLCQLKGDESPKHQIFKVDSMACHPCIIIITPNLQTSQVTCTGLDNVSVLEQSISAVAYCIMMNSKHSIYSLINVAILKPFKNNPQSDVSGLWKTPRHSQFHSIQSPAKHPKFHQSHSRKLRLFHLCVLH